MFIAAIAATPPARANHGPGTSGGGSSTASGETLKQGAFDFSVRVDFTQYEDVSREEAETRAATAGEFDALDNSLIVSLSLSYGITDDLQAGVQIGYYLGNNFIDAEFDADTATTESATGDPRGLTDLWLTMKYRVMKGEPGHLSVIAGIKLPTGRDSVRLDSGEQLEPSSQPGSGTVDFQLGLAYSRFLTPQVTLDVSAVHTFRTRHDGFKVGDRLDLGMALAYRLTPDVRQFPQVILFGEVLGVILWKDEEGGDRNPNSGGATMYLSPGVRVRFCEGASLTIAPAVPVAQDLNGDQVETRFKLGVTFELSF